MNVCFIKAFLHRCHPENVKFLHSIKKRKYSIHILLFLNYGFVEKYILSCRYFNNFRNILQYHPNILCGKEKEKVKLIENKIEMEMKTRI
jgi:hypothetical protein